MQWQQSSEHTVMQRLQEAEIGYCGMPSLILKPFVDGWRRAFSSSAKLALAAEVLEPHLGWNHE